MAGGKSVPIIAIAAAPLLVVGALLSVLLMGGAGGAAPGCNPAAGSTSSVSLDVAAVPGGPIAGYSGPQLVNAAYVVNAGRDLGIGVRDQTIGVMTAMGESNLTVLDHGDAAGPDSRGLFQQRDNGSWGTYADRMDPHISTTNFFKAMMQVSDRESLEPTIIAQRTQHNADPGYYAQFWNGAVSIVEGLAGVKSGLNLGTGGQVCSAGTLIPGAVNDHGWATPGAGPVNSSYGMRVDPVSGSFTRAHVGVDLQAGGCDGPIWAAHDGTVSVAGMTTGGAGIIAIDHGSGVVTRYVHMYASGILTHVGDHVSAGQQIGRVGSTGNSTGCHLHYEVMVDSKNIDPEPFMTAAGITLGQ